MTRITFLGAAGTVTGSKYLVGSDDFQLLVDCGLFQGVKWLRERNWSAFPVDATSIDSVVLTHAHIDHSGYLPRLFKLGFSGMVYCTQGTADLLHILLRDTAFLQQEEARHANKHRFSKHRPAIPLFTTEDVEACLRHVRPMAYYEHFLPAKSVTASFTRAGHIVGSGCLTLKTNKEVITFSGDVGRPHDPIMKAPDLLPQTDYLVVESTYGSRHHPREDPINALEELVTKCMSQKSVLLIPAFAVGRAQHILHLLAELRNSGKIPNVPIFLDSPMAIKATEIYCQHQEDHNLNNKDIERLRQVATCTAEPKASMEIDIQAGPMIIISASGMATGGRILHHLRQFLPDPNNVVLIVGFQAAGTRGRSLLDGADEIKIFGEYIPVKARIIEIEGLSAHGDYQELIEWLRQSKVSPKRVFVTHGEPSEADAFRRRLVETFSWDTVVPTDGSAYVLGVQPQGETP